MPRVGEVVARRADQGQCLVGAAGHLVVDFQLVSQLAEVLVAVANFGVRLNGCVQRQKAGGTVGRSFADMATEQAQ